MIHESSVVSPKAKLGKNVVVGPFCRIVGDVTIGDDSVLESHVVIGSDFGRVVIGRNNRFFSFSQIGGSPQDLKYKNETTALTIGDGNTFRECVTVSIGTVTGRGETKIGHQNLFMAYSHVGHDCIIGSHNVLANQVQMAGHVTVEDKVTVGGLVGINQFVTIGRNAFVTGGALVNKDVLPYSICQGSYARTRAANKVGLERSGFSDVAVSNISRAMRILTLAKGTVEESLVRINDECEKIPEVDYLVDFIKKSERGVAL